MVSCFVDAALFAAASGTQLLDDLNAELADSSGRLAGLRPQASAWRALPRLIAHPVVNAAFLRRHLQFNEMTAQRALAQLTEHGVLEERSGLRRNRVYQHPGILRTLDAYAQQLSRR